MGENNLRRRAVKSLRVLYYDLTGEGAKLPKAMRQLLRACGLRSPKWWTGSPEVVLRQCETPQRLVLFLRIKDRYDQAKSWLKEHPCPEHVAIVLFGRTPEDAAVRQHFLGQLGAFAYLHEGMQPEVQQTILNTLRRWDPAERVLNGTHTFAQSYETLSSFDQATSLLVKHVCESLQACRTNLLERCGPTLQRFVLRAEHPQDTRCPNIGTVFEFDKKKNSNMGMSPLAAHSQEIVTVPDVERSLIFDPQVELGKHRAAVAVPLVVGGYGRPGTLVGVLNVFWREPRYPTPAEFRYLRTIANMAAVTLRTLQVRALLNSSLAPRPYQTDPKRPFTKIAAKTLVRPLLDDSWQVLGHRRVAVRLLRDNVQSLHVIWPKEECRKVAELETLEQVQKMIGEFKEPAPLEESQELSLLPIRNSKGEKVCFSRFVLRTSEDHPQVFGDLLFEEPLPEGEISTKTLDWVTELELKQMLVRRLSTKLTTARRRYDKALVETTLSRFASTNDGRFLKGIGRMLLRRFGCDSVKIYVVLRRNRRRRLERVYHSDPKVGTTPAHWDLGRTWQLEGRENPEPGVHRYAIRTNRWVLIPNVGNPDEEGKRGCYCEGSAKSDQVHWVSESELVSPTGKPAAPTEDRTVIVAPLRLGDKVIGTIEIGRKHTATPFLAQQDPQQLVWFSLRLAEPLQRFALAERAAQDLEHMAEHAASVARWSEADLEHHILGGARSLTGAALALLFRKDENPLYSEKGKELVLRQAHMSRGIKDLSHGEPSLVGTRVGLSACRISYQHEDPEHWRSLINKYLKTLEVRDFLEKHAFESKAHILPLSFEESDPTRKTPASKRRQELMGMIVLLNRPPDRFTHTEVEHGTYGLDTYLGQAAALLRTHQQVYLARVADRFFEIRRKAEANGGANGQALLQAVVRLAREFCTARAAFVYRVENGCLTVVAHALECNRQAPEDGLWVAPNGITEKALTTGQAIRLRNLGHPPSAYKASKESLERLQKWLDEKPVSWLAVPDKSRAVVLKVVNKREIIHKDDASIERGALDAAFTRLDELVLRRLIELAGPDVEKANATSVCTSLRELTAKLKVEGLDRAAKQVHALVNPFLGGQLERFCVVRNQHGEQPVFWADPDTNWNEAAVAIIRDHGSRERVVFHSDGRTDMPQAVAGFLKPGTTAVFEALRFGSRVVGYLAVLVGPPQSLANENLLHEVAREIAPTVDVYSQLSEYAAYKEMLGRFTHAVKLPLHAMISHSAMLRDVLQEHGITLPEEAEEALEIMEQEAAVARANINFNTRFLSDSMEINQQPSDLAALVRKCVARFRVRACARNVDLLLEPQILGDPAFHQWLQFDPHAVEMILSNLLDNALKYAFSPSIVVIKLGDGPKGRGASIVIEDLGHGIPTSRKECLFEPFHRGEVHDPRRPIPGTGIGLYVSWRLAQAHGGELELIENKQVGEERPDRPAPHKVRFRLSLPGDLQQEKRPTNRGGRQ